MKWSAQVPVHAFELKLNASRWISLINPGGLRVGGKRGSPVPVTPVASALLG
jgi:hypothetical protein